MLGRWDEAFEHFRLAASGNAARPWINLEAEALDAVARDDLDALPALVSRINAWENPEAEDRVRAMWAWALVDRGRADQAVGALENTTGFMGRVSRALALGRSGQGEAALIELPNSAEVSEREPLLYWHACRYRLTRESSDLHALVNLTQSGVQVLPALVPLNDLPRNRPDLADAYPLGPVLESGWKEAITRRLAEVPYLEVKVLGEFRVRRLGREIELAPRPRALLLLLVLGLRRDEIAEALWPELTPTKSRNNLHVNLNFLRKGLEPWGVTTYLSEGGLLRTRADLWALQAALEREDAQAVMDLYRGPLAPDESLPVVDEAREGLQAQVVNALLRAAQRHQPEQAEACLERALGLDPLNEVAFEHLLRLLVESGRRQTARRRYAGFARRVFQESPARVPGDGSRTPAANPSSPRTTPVMKEPRPSVDVCFRTPHNQFACNQPSRLRCSMGSGTSPS